MSLQAKIALKSKEDRFLNCFTRYNIKPKVNIDQANRKRFLKDKVSEAPKKLQQRLSNLLFNIQWLIGYELSDVSSLSLSFSISKEPVKHRFRHPTNDFLETFFYHKGNTRHYGIGKSR